MATTATLTFSENFSAAIAVWPTGYDASGKPVWSTEWFWGARSGDDTTDAGYFADATIGYNPVSVANGAATITATPIGQIPITGAPSWITHASGMLTSDTTFSQQYGYYEFSAKNPAGSGFLGALWLLPENHAWPPEIDVSEVDGGNPTTVIETVHTAQTGIHTASAGWVTVSDTTVTFHTYGLNWGPNQITYYVDGKETFHVATPADANRPMYMVLSLHVGGAGSWHGDASNTASSSMQIDYVKVWNWTGAGIPAGAVGGPASVTAATATDIGTGSEAIVLTLSETAYQGDAQLTVSVDGKQIGGTLTAHALHGSGVADTVTVRGAFGGGSHTVSTKFLNDAWGGSDATDRNLYVQSATYNGKALLSGEKILAGTGDHADASFTGLYQPVTKTIGSGTSALVLKVSQDVYQGSTQYTVMVDGKAVGSTLTASALHAAGQDDIITVKGNWGGGHHTASVTFLNDGWGGSGDADRNLHVDAVTYNGAVVSSVSTPLYVSGAHADYAW